LKGQWSIRAFIDTHDVVRVIGEFSLGNSYHLLIDDFYEGKPHQATMMIVEPSIMIATTQIVKASPCTRKAFLGNQYKNIHNDINYPLVLGNVIHEIF
jgi:hypothetical protein